MMKDPAVQPKVLVIPCSGVGKVQGLLSREVTYLVTDELAPGRTDTRCLALLVKDDPEAIEDVRRHPCIAIDGCAKACAQKNLELAGGNIATYVQVQRHLNKHRGAQPGNGSVLTQEGWKIAREIAEEVAATAERLCAGEAVSR
jgi:uncharacterized metal-binding protein